MHKTFNSSQEAFEVLYDEILENGLDYIGTKTIFNATFTILNPLDNEIYTPWRKWSKDYAEYEWSWYLSGDRSARDIEKRAKIWTKMYDPNDINKYVNSNYGYQWKRQDQLEKVIELLRKDKFTRRALISIYDGKELDDYAFDTPCTMYVGFHISPETPDKLDCSVSMRSNDLFFGTCLDVYFFTKLQKMVADELDLEVGTYFHHAINLHIYECHFHKKSKWEEINGTKYINKVDFNEDEFKCTHKQFYANGDAL